MVILQVEGVKSELNTLKEKERSLDEEPFSLVQKNYSVFL